MFVSATVAVTASLADVDNRLAERNVDLLIADIAATDGDVCDHVSSWGPGNCGGARVLIATRHTEAAVVHSLRNTPVAGIFDTAADDLELFSMACSAVLNGGSYWSVSVMRAIHDAHSGADAIFQLLTSTEQMVLGVIGDGCDDRTAAQILTLTPSSIRSVREALHRKLSIQHKGQLIERAAYFGFVLRTADKVIRPGLKALIAAHRQPTRKPAAPGLRFVA